MENKLNKTQSLQKPFLVANTIWEVILKIPFFIFSNVNIQFAWRELIWKSYTMDKALSTTKRVELINKKEFAKAVLDKNSETFVVYMVFLNLALEIHPDKNA